MVNSITSFLENQQLPIDEKYTFTLKAFVFKERKESVSQVKSWTWFLIVIIKFSSRLPRRKEMSKG
jgi:hypothetical protein